MIFPICAHDIDSLSCCPVCRGERLELISEVFQGELNFFNTVFCAKCGFVFRQKRPNESWFCKSWRLRDAQVKSAANSKRVALVEQYRRVRYKNLSAFLETVVKEKEILDIGTGPGTGLKVFQDSGWKTTGLEPDPARARIAREEHRLNIIEATIESYTERENSFPLVTVVHALEHMHYPLEFLRHVVRQAAEGGFVYIEVPDLASFIDWRDALYLEHVNNFTVTTLSLLALQAGLAPLYRLFPKTTPFGVLHLGILFGKQDTAARSLAIEPQVPLAQVNKLYRKGLIGKREKSPLRFYVEDIMDICRTVPGNYIPRYLSSREGFRMLPAQGVLDLPQKMLPEVLRNTPLQIMQKVLLKSFPGLLKDAKFENLGSCPF